MENKHIGFFSIQIMPNIGISRHVTYARQTLSSPHGIWKISTSRFFHTNNIYHLKKKKKKFWRHFTPFTIPSNTNTLHNSSSFPFIYIHPHLPTSIFIYSLFFFSFLLIFSSTPAHPRLHSYLPLYPLYPGTSSFYPGTSRFTRPSTVTLS